MLDAMMREANAVKKAKAAAKAKATKKQAKSFGSSMSKGLKKGFLSGGGTKKKKKTTTTTTTKKKASAASKRDSEIEELKPTGQPGDGLVIDDVQRALRSAGLGDAKSTASKTLMEQLLANPAIRRGMQKPRLLASLQAMGAAPQRAAQIMAAAVASNDQELVEFVQTVMTVMGDFFTTLGDKQAAEEAATAKKAAAKAKKAAKKVQQLVEEEITSPEVVEKRVAQAAAATNDPQVQRVLGNPELRAVLTDPRMKGVLNECSTKAGALQHYMRHPEFGPKLRMMAQAGLIQLQC